MTTIIIIQVKRDIPWEPLIPSGVCNYIKTKPSNTIPKPNIKIQKEISKNWIMNRVSYSGSKFPNSNSLAMKEPNSDNAKQKRNSKTKFHFSLLFLRESRKEVQIFERFLLTNQTEKKKDFKFYSPLRNGGGIDGVRRRQRLLRRNRGRSTVVEGVAGGGVGTDLHEWRSRWTGRPNLMNGWDLWMKEEKESKSTEKETILRENEVCKEQKWMELLNAMLFAANYCFIIFSIFTIVYHSTFHFLFNQTS